MTKLYYLETTKRKLNDERSAPLTFNVLYGIKNHNDLEHDALSKGSLTVAIRTRTLKLYIAVLLEYNAITTALCSTKLAP